MTLRCVRVRSKLDGRWLKVLGWGLGAQTLEWTLDKERSFLFVKDDWVLSKARKTLRCQGVDMETLELVEEDWNQEAAIRAEMGQPAGE